MSVEIGKKIALKRFEKGMIQDALASEAKIAQSRLSDIENGRSPKWNELEQIATALDIPISELLPANVLNISNNTFSSNEESEQHNNVGNITINIPPNYFKEIITNAIKESKEKN